MTFKALTSPLAAESDRQNHTKMRRSLPAAGRFFPSISRQGNSAAPSPPAICQDGLLEHSFPGSNVLHLLPKIQNKKFKNGSLAPIGLRPAGPRLKLFHKTTKVKLSVPAGAVPTAGNGESKGRNQGPRAGRAGRAAASSRDSQIDVIIQIGNKLTGSGSPRAGPRIFGSAPSARKED